MIIPANAQALLERTYLKFNWLIWITAKNRDTGEPVSLGLSTSVYDQTVTVSGVERTYNGAAGVLQLPDFNFASGTEINTNTLALSGLTQESKTLFRLYDSRQAPVEIHLLLENPDNGVFQPPIKVLDGFINSVSINEDQAGETIEAELVSTLRGATKTLTLTKSDTSQRLRDSTDTGRKYCDQAGKIPVFWGRKGGGNYSYGGMSRRHLISGRIGPDYN